MNKFNKTIALILAVLMLTVLMAAACSSNEPEQQAGNGNDEENTQEPAQTTPAPSDEPEPNETEKPTNELTEEPATDEPEFPTEYFYAVLEENIPFTCDLDFDGKDDTVTFVAVAHDDYSAEFSLQFTLGCNPNNTISLDFDCEAYYGKAFITDSDKYDSRLDVIATFGYDSDDNSTCLYRVDRTGYNIDFFEEYASVLPIDEEHDVFARDGQFYMGYRTEILGTTTVSALCEAGEDGFHNAVDTYFYGDYVYPVEAINDVPVTLIDDNYEATGESTMAKGSTVLPVETDRATFVIVQLEDGSYARIDIEIVDGWHPYINQMPQEYYFNVMYAD